MGRKSRHVTDNYKSRWFIFVELTLFYLLPACHYFTDDVTPTCAGGKWRGGTKHIRKNTTQRKILNGRKKKNDDLTMSFHIFFVNLPKRRKRTKRRRHPAYADTQKGGCKTHIARMSVSHGTLCRHSRHLRTGRRRARLHNEHDNDGRAARQHDRKRHTYQLT